MPSTSKPHTVHTDIIIEISLTRPEDGAPVVELNWSGALPPVKSVYFRPKIVVPDDDLETVFESAIIQRDTSSELQGITYQLPRGSYDSALPDNTDSESASDTYLKAEYVLFNTHTHDAEFEIPESIPDSEFADTIEDISIIDSYQLLPISD